MSSSLFISPFILKEEKQRFFCTDKFAATAQLKDVNVMDACTPVGLAVSHRQQRSAGSSGAER